MAQPIQVLTLQKVNLENFARRFMDDEGKMKGDLFSSHQTEVEKAFIDSGGKRIVLAQDVWGFSGWSGFMVAEFPDFESFQGLQKRAMELQYGRYFEQMRVPGVDMLKDFQAQENIKQAHK